MTHSTNTPDVRPLAIIARRHDDHWITVEHEPLAYDTTIGRVITIAGCERVDGDADDFFPWLLCNQYAEINLLA